MLQEEALDRIAHRLLRRQIRKQLPPELAEHPGMADFLAAVDLAYGEFGEDINRVERILEQSSNELFKANRELKRIAEEKTAEAALTSRRLEEVVSSISEIIIQLDGKGSITYLNTAWEKVTGYPVKSSLHKKLSDFDLSSSACLSLAMLLSQEAESLNEIIQFFTTSGTDKWLQLSLRRQISPQHEHIGYIGTLVDVTSQYQARMELSRLALVVKTTKNSMLIADADGRITWANDAFTKLTGYSLEESLGKVPGRLLQGEKTDPAVRTIINTKLKEKESFQGEIINYSRSGRAYWVELFIEPLFDEDTQHIGFIAVQNEVTERVEAEKKLKAHTRDLERINAELDQFAYVVSHDLKAPLRAINNLSEWIEEDISHLLEGETRDQFKLLRGRVFRMENLINGILQYSRAGRIKAIADQVPVRPLVEEICDALRVQDELSFNLLGDDLFIHTEKIVLQQILQNLISNGIKYNDKKRIAITISWEDKGSHLNFAVTDNGPGIRPEFHEKIFVIFQTLQARDEIESTGVGLAIVKKIIDEKGCNIWVESTMGEGTTFHFTWPKAER
ncbi:PAS domain S-box protein [Telluribacter sp.]|jgi:PAS domain S-box-containing protein|uniref:PAS domain S-box protein n=1 Tax=Telluribacter sp. TaxID=1978767 RepID=UPI002E0F5243|nr:PAS domain S-box protein [Telluribacter sp.]